MSEMSSDMVEFLWIVLKEPVITSMTIAIVLTIIFAIVAIFNPLFKPKSIED